MNLETYFTKNRIPFEKHIHTPAYTAQGLAQAEHVSGYQVAKPVVVRTGSGFAMCVLTAPQHLDRKRVADVLKEGEVRLATESEMAGLFPDCELGAEPPFGNVYNLPVYVDESLRKDPEIVFNAGTHTEAIRMRYADLVRPVIAVLSSAT